ncbi:hypothetical protein [Billgrantia montanilacus]|uniref:Uncharacterized protein n=1 Tax=Billgrantia montanilacus TaxID=2282305 RepID=A0A368U0E9_9GAMM|nr:hypothetical protein [Halomonas montanilacus]RCV90494.1 hypothetical protein DU505_06040 [Halomonas montanilacus]
MIDHALVLLETTDLPSWEKDAPLRRELLRLDEECRAYHIAAYCPDRAARIAKRVNERAARITAFMKGHRHGTHARRQWADFMESTL